MNTADITKGATYRSTIVRADGVVILSRVTSITATRVYYLNNGIEMCGVPAVFAKTHVPA